MGQARGSGREGLVSGRRARAGSARRLPAQWWQAGFVAEQPLPGGFVTDVVRAGITVRRAPPADPEFVHALLGWFERHRWDGAPRFLGTDELGRQRLSFIDGHVAWEPGQPPSVTSDVSLARLAVLVREFHDQTAGTPLAAGGDVVCPNDVSPSTGSPATAPNSIPTSDRHQPRPHNPQISAGWSSCCTLPLTT